MLKGGCLCGAMRYEAGGKPFHQTSCHCTICRRASGAPFVAWFSVPRSQLRWVQGEPTRFQSSAKGTRSFCARCGTQLSFELEGLGEEIDLTICSLDDPDALPPKDHTWSRSRLAWVKLDDGLAQFKAGRQTG